MKLFITHANTCYDKDKVAKKGIEEILNHFKPDDIVELDNTFGGKNSGKRYTKHKGMVVYSSGGHINIDLPERLKRCKKGTENLIKKLGEWKEKEFILTGGYFGLCHSTTFKTLYECYKGNVFIFPLEAIFYHGSYPNFTPLLKNLSYIDIVKRINNAYCNEAKIYLDNKLVKRGKEDCTIKIFSENKLLYSLL